jgi:hypothetical protein
VKRRRRAAILACAAPMVPPSCAPPVSATTSGSYSLCCPLVLPLIVRSLNLIRKNSQESVPRGAAMLCAKRRISSRRLQHQRKSWTQDYLLPADPRKKSQPPSFPHPVLSSWRSKIGLISYMRWMAIALMN